LLERELLCSVTTGTSTAIQRAVGYVMASRAVTSAEVRRFLEVTVRRSGLDLDEAARALIGEAGRAAEP
jgi:hypothetical protein